MNSFAVFQAFITFYFMIPKFLKAVAYVSRQQRNFNDICLFTGLILILQNKGLEGTLKTIFIIKKHYSWIPTIEF